MDKNTIPEYNTHFFSFKGRIGRKDSFVAIFLYFIIFLLYLTFIIYEILKTNPLMDFNNFITYYQHLYFFPLLLEIYLVQCVYAKRFRDIKWNPWLSLLGLIPFIDIIIFFLSIVVKGKYDINENMPINKKSNYKILVWILILFIIGFSFIVVKDYIKKEEKFYLNCENEYLFEIKENQNKIYLIEDVPVELTTFKWDDYHIEAGKQIENESEELIECRKEFEEYYKNYNDSMETFDCDEFVDIDYKPYFKFNRFTGEMSVCDDFKSTSIEWDAEVHDWRINGLTAEEEEKYGFKPQYKYSCQEYQCQKYKNLSI